MGLVDYSDSDPSDGEDTKQNKPSVTTSKAAFQKVVDRSNPGKIRVTLPQHKSEIKEDGLEPTAKRVKLGGGDLGGFNSFLPPPKRTGMSSGPKSGLGSGVNLKTGTAPGFSRESHPISLPETTEGETEDDTEGGTMLQPPKTNPENSNQIPAGEVKLVGKPLMFKPLSVVRKSTKKKRLAESSYTASAVTADVIASTTTTEGKVRLPKKISLFNISSEPNDAPPSSSTGEYQPIVYGATDIEGYELEYPEVEESQFEDRNRIARQNNPTPDTSTMSLDSIASDLNLSAAEKRQLFGRGKGSKNGTIPSATKIINFNTDNEYRHNEDLRASGEQVAHNPVRSIAPGKHNLRQLVNAVASQRDALEDSFAKGRANRKEAGSKYGW